MIYGLVTDRPADVFFTRSARVLQVRNGSFPQRGNPIVIFQRRGQAIAGSFRTPHAARRTPPALTSRSKDWRLMDQVGIPQPTRIDAGTESSFSAARQGCRMVEAVTSSHGKQTEDGGATTR